MERGELVVFGFGKKKKKELSVPPAMPPLDASHSMEGTISLDDALPPPIGFDEDIPPPRAIDEIEIPETHHSTPLEKLEFPSLPKEPPAPGGMPAQSNAKVEFFDDDLEVPSPKIDDGEMMRIDDVEEHEMDLPSLEGEEHEGITPILHDEPRLESPAEPQVIREKGGPLYVSLNQFGNLMQTIAEIKGTLKGCGDSLSSINDIKNQEDTKLAKWHGDVENIQRKLIYVDKVLFE